MSLAVARQCCNQVQYPSDMAENSKIEWTEHTFNPWWGCIRVSPACKNCYAEAMAKMYGHRCWGAKSERRFLSDAHWRQPLKWDKQAEADGVRRRVFCASMADVFEDREELIPWRQRLWALIEATPHLDWLLLTKRPENIAQMGPASGFPANVWLGTTVENQKYADLRIPELSSVPAAVHFLSCEPLLGPLNLSNWLPMLDWVIAGGESGAKARPTDPKWFESLRDQCKKFRVNFLFKQWGNWTPHKPDVTKLKSIELPTGISVYRTTKKAAGRLLGGRTWDGVPAGTVPTVPMLPRSGS